MDPASALFPICAELRSKKYFLLGQPPRTSAEVLDASNDCWCARTDDRLGPDKDPVHPDDCRSARRCFRSLLEREAGEPARELG